MLQIYVWQYPKSQAGFNDPLLVEQEKGEVVFFGLVLTVMVWLGLRPEWVGWFTTCFGLFWFAYLTITWQSAYCDIGMRDFDFSELTRNINDILGIVNRG